MQLICIILYFIVFMQRHSSKSVNFDLDSCINHLAHWLPTQGPIKDFVHHNTLHAFQNLPFHEALSVAGRLFGAQSYLALSEYHARYKQGRISDNALDWAVSRTPLDDQAKADLKASLFAEDKHGYYPPRSLANDGIRTTWMRQIEMDLNALVHPILFRLLANYLDQGISQWVLAKPEEGFLECIVRLSQNSFIPIYPFDTAQAKELLLQSADQIVLTCLSKLVGDEQYYEQYLLEVLLAHPGWSGMVRIVETTPNSLLVKRFISLKEMLAIELLAELSVIESRKGECYAKVNELPDIHEIPSLKTFLHPKIAYQYQVWHEAMEWTLHCELLAALANPVSAAKGGDQYSSDSVKAQALFCIDDRSCSVRRYLEENSAIDTFGAAGFFGIDFFYQGIEDAYPVAQCPAVVKPKHLVLEEGERVKRQNKSDSLKNAHFTAHSMLRGWLYTQTIGLGYAVKMAWNVFRPNKKLPGIEPLSNLNAHSHLHLLREHDEPNEEGLLLGFSYSEMADRVGGLLTNIGLINRFSPIVVVIAHGSSSVNNPHFAAYDCGACSGKPGAPNARAFAWMANQTAVRDILQERGIVIPRETVFIAAMHNTSRDEITYYDESPETLAIPELSAFKVSMQLALEHNANERCRWFQLGPQMHTDEASHQHVMSRSVSIFEPRPELNHSNNLYCVVGPRTLTRKLFLDRRAFLHSYEPQYDPRGDILLKILTAVIPVCGGINLEYLFCRIDNSAYGAGTKLPHNVIGLLGVANGVEGDLRTGLPHQMIEVHEPSRLMLLVNQETEIIDKSLSRLGILKEWLDNEWVRLVSHGYQAGEQKLYSKSGWIDIELPVDAVTPSGENSTSIIDGRHKTIPVHHLQG